MSGAQRTDCRLHGGPSKPKASDFQLKPLNEVQQLLGLDFLAKNEGIAPLGWVDRKQVAAVAAATLVGAIWAGSAAYAMSVLQIPGILGDSPLREGIVSGFLLIFFSEIGDKTFFIALLLAAQRSRALVFTGTFGALAVMTLISVSLGAVFHQLDMLLPPGLQQYPIDDILAIVLLVVFGVQTLRGADEAAAEAAEEREEAEKVVQARDSQTSDATFVLSTFALVFAAEWGDKSFLATIALAAASDPAGVTIGAVGGHGVATAIAVVGGSILSQYVSEKVLKYAGGTLFLVFAAATALDLVL